MDYEKKRQPTLFIGLGGAGGKIVNRIATILGKRDDWDLLDKTMQFFVVDTDKADLDACSSVPQAHRFAISGFDKGLWVMDKLGRGGVSKPDPDPRVSQWVHDWYNFRSSQGAGAGQIRIESRVSLYNSLESTDLIKRLETAILSTIDMKNTMLSYEVKKFNVFLYYTVAGGTGSGAHLMFASFLRNLIGNFGWSANITGISMLSTLVLPKIRNMRQREDIMANGYSAMKEDEHLMRLKVFSDTRDPSNRREFIYHPFVSTKEVGASPFDFIYVLDTNPEVHIEDWGTSAADGIYLQLFSPIFGVRNSDYDNFEKNQKRLARGIYSTFYGSYGCSVLLLPDKDLLEYCCKRKTADLIQDHLSANLTLPLASGAESYAPDTKELEGMDTKERDKLWDKKFVEYMRDRVLLMEDTRPSQASQPELLKQHGRALNKSGFGLELDLLGLESAIDTIGKKQLGKEDRPALHKYILPEDIAPDQGSADGGEDSGDAGKNNKGWGFKSNLESYLLSFRGLGDMIGGNLHLETMENGRYKLAPGLFQEFWKHLDDTYLNDAAENVKFAHCTTTRGDSAKEENWDDMQDIFEDNIGKNRQELEGSRERVKRMTNGVRETLGRKLISDFLAKDETSFELQRLFVVTHLRLSRAVCVILGRILEDNDPDMAQDQLAHASGIIRDDDSLRDASKTEWREWVDEWTKNEGATDFKEEVERLDRWVNTISSRYSALIYLQFYHDLHKQLAEVFRDLSSTFRLFSQQADREIQQITTEADAYRKRPGGDAMSEEYHNDIEVLQDFRGDRMWDEYYDVFVRESVDIRTQEVHKIIAETFSDSRLVTARDQIDQIRMRMWKIVRGALDPKIVGAYSEGKDNRGLTLQQGLEAEAQLKFRERLKAVGRWEDNEQNWKNVISTPVKDLHSRSERELADQMAKFSRNYLESKVSSCIRRSAIMANIDMEDVQVTEFACKQAMVCYDQNLYGKPEADSASLDFPHLVHRIAPEYIPQDYPDYGKMVIFYKAILGVPLFVFRNLITGMKESYNKRVLERDWSQPMFGRQYPLHIDKNWEMGDPGVDESKLPLSLDPEEAVVSSRMTNAERSKFFAYWYALYKTDHIIRDEERGFIVPSGMLSNPGPDILLGATVRDAIQSMMKAPSAHETLRDAFENADPIEESELIEQRDYCLGLLGGDAWGRNEPEPEIKELADLLQEYLEFNQKQAELDEKKAKRSQAYNQGVGKTD